MSRQIILVRHAQAENGGYNLKDFNRELTEEGIIQASKTAVLIKESGGLPDFLLCSSAVRARDTAFYMTEQWGFPEEKISREEELYQASVRSLVSRINELEDACQRVVLIGHNPVITHLAEYLTGDTFNSLDYCGTVAVKFELNEWQAVSGQTGMVEWSFAS